VNFALPDLRGRAQTHMGAGLTLGEKGGEEAHTLSISELPAHIHAPVTATSTAADQPTPTSNLLGQVDLSAFTTHLYQTFANPVAMAAASIGNTGGSQPHQNMQPFLVLNFCIALQGIFPSQT